MAEPLPEQSEGAVKPPRGGVDGDHARMGTLAVPGHRSRRQTAKPGTHRGGSLGKASGNCGDSEWLGGWGGGRWGGLGALR